jgi:peptidyl-prolyl cis-trans isomerase SurA
MATMEDLEKAAQEQGASYEDFKATIRNQIVTQEVMRQEVGRHVNITPGEVRTYFDSHKQEYVQPESVRLSEILISTGTAAPAPEGGSQEDPAKVEGAKAKADDLVAKLKAGADFGQLARSSSEGPTASTGGDLGQFRRGALAKVLEDATFSLNAGQYTEPIRTRQGYVILKVDQHVHGGVPQYNDVQQQVEQDYWDSKMMLTIRDYLTRCGGRVCRGETWAYRHRREPEPARTAYLLFLLHAAFSEEEEEGGAHAFPRDHAHFPQQGTAGAGRERRGRHGDLSARGEEDQKAKGDS